MEQRHNAVLQMYGEKAEQAEELRMDLEDVKSMYKSQVTIPAECCSFVFGLPAGLKLTGLVVVFQIQELLGASR